MDRDLCLGCRYLRPLSGGCAAYPEGIPLEISSGAVRHDTIRDDQQGAFVYEPGEPEELKALKRSTSK